MRVESRKRKLEIGKSSRAIFHFPFSIFYIAVLLAFLVVACGKKGDPRVPELAVPETIRDLRADPGSRGIALTWSRPLRYIDGKELRELAGFVIFRKEITKACPDCPVPYRQLAMVSVEDQQKFIKKSRFRFVDDEVAAQSTFRYRIFSRLQDGSLSDPSNEVEAVWRP